MYLISEVEQLRWQVQILTELDQQLNLVLSVTATTASGSASLTTGSVSVSAGAKDAGATTVLNSVSSTGHTTCHYTDNYINVYY